MAKKDGVEYVSNNVEAQKLLDKMEDNILLAIGAFVDGEAVSRAPVGTYEGGKTGGNLRSSIRHIVDKGKKTVRIGTPVEYAIYVEKGTGIYAEKGDGRKTPWLYVDDMGIGHFTRGMKPQPFLQPAVDENISKIKSIIKAVKFGGIG